MEGTPSLAGNSSKADAACDARIQDSSAAEETVEAYDASRAGLAGVARNGSEDTGSLSAPLGGDADLLRRDYDESLDALAGIVREEAKLAARKVRTVARCARAARAMAPPGLSLPEETAQEMAVVAEVACVLAIREAAAADLLAEAYELTTTLPLTMSALEAGSISWAHARIMVDEAGSLGPGGAQALEAHFLDPDDPNPARGCPAGEMAAGLFRQKARIWRERHHPVSIEKRHIKCAADRRVMYAPDRDGMAWLSAYLPAGTASGIWDRLTRAARAMQCPEEARTLTQLRADTAASWLLRTSGGSNAGGSAGDSIVGASRDPRATGRANGARGALPVADSSCASTGDTADVLSPRAQVLVTVPVLALLGVTEEPAMLDGYGPIPPSMARQLIANGAESFHRVLIDPRDGAPLEIGRTSYRVTTAQRQWLRLRDGKCPFPGCSNHSLDNEADHVLAWALGGTTGIANLGQPCPRHHRLRHTTAWKPTEPTKNEPPGWISPAGRHYQSEQPDWEPPTWPPQWPGLPTLLGQTRQSTPVPLE
ncbi:DUF222 domain-containing protein [Arthrobacter sp. UYCo732]|uniref:HNH endonuclease signature motif containing protein n=1 Tax=Arthrobacter sp. UYCo732 TaxID=3156336 RepID=UPI00339435B4